MNPILLVVLIILGVLAVDILVSKSAQRVEEYIDEVERRYRS